MYLCTEHAPFSPLCEDMFPREANHTDNCEADLYTLWVPEPYMLTLGGQEFSFSRVVTGNIP